MKIINVITVLSMCLLVSCGQKDEQSKNAEVIKINYLKNYPNKELELHKIADVKYLALKTTNDKPFQGRIAYCDNELIIGFAKSIKDVIVFSGQGAETYRFNHVGKGPKEYEKSSSLSYNPQSKEIFIKSTYSKSVKVYSLKGEFKRSFYTYNKMLYTSLIPFNNDLIAYNKYLDSEKIAYLKTSAKDGELLEIIDTHFKKKREIDLIENWDSKGTMSFSWYDRYLQVFCGKNLLVNDFSSDTIYCYTTCGKVLPHTAITPSFEKAPDPWVVLVNGESQQHCYYTAIKMEKPAKDKKADVKSLIYDKTNGAINEVRLYDKNYPDYEHFFRHPRGNGLFIEQLEAYSLIERNKKGKLAGELKDLALTLDINNNPVLMIIQLKDKM